MSVRTSSIADVIGELARRLIHNGKVVGIGSSLFELKCFPHSTLKCVETVRSIQITILWVISMYRVISLFWRFAGTLSSSEGKNEWSYTSAPFIRLHGVDRDNHFFTYFFKRFIKHDRQGSSVITLLWVRCSFKERGHSGQNEHVHLNTGKAYFSLTAWIKRKQSFISACTFLSLPWHGV
jgi:hypothetical protein